MAQNWTDDTYAADHAGQTDLQNMENNFNVLKTNFSGASAPPGAVAGMDWYHTSKGLRIRNAGNSAWLKIWQGSASAKTWFYRNDTDEGWVVDTSVTDRVLAIKGGSQAYNVSGGNQAGIWTISGITVNNESAHTHGPGSLNVDIRHRHLPGDEYLLGDGFVVEAYEPGEGGTTPNYSDHQGLTNKGVLGTSAAGSAHTHGLTFGGAWRPAAAVGTLQYPDLS
jgi:hypothetical protein